MPRITTADLRRFNSRIRTADYSAVRRLSLVFFEQTACNTPVSVAKRFAIEQAIRVLNEIRIIVESRGL